MSENILKKKISLTYYGECLTSEYFISCTSGYQAQANRTAAIQSTNAALKQKGQKNYAYKRKPTLAQETILIPRDKTLLSSSNASDYYEIRVPKTIGTKNCN